MFVLSAALLLAAACAPAPDKPSTVAADTPDSGPAKRQPTLAPAPSTDSRNPASDAGASANGAVTPESVAKGPVIAVAQTAGKTPERQPARATRHMVSTANSYATRAARAMLEAGGTAVDAAIAAQLVLNIVEPQSSGIGGGGFMLHYTAATGEIVAYDGRETAPAAASADMFLDRDGKPRQFFDAVVGGLSVGVPGLLRMLEIAHRTHGALPWADLFRPAIKLAEDGFAISPRLHGFLARDTYLRTSAAAAAYFYDPDGVPKSEGRVLKNASFAKTLRLIADNDAKVLYSGEIARSIVDTVRRAPRNPGRLEMADLTAYRAVARFPVCAPYRVWLVCGMPPPSSGGITTLQILGILESFDLPSLDPQSVEAVHLISEASRLAYADRNALIADDDFVDVPVGQLLDPSYLAKRAEAVSLDHSIGTATPGLIDDQAAAPPAAGTPDEGLSTTHLSIIDSSGNVVALTSSIESAFGSRLMVAGFLLNNQLTDFAFQPVRAGKPVANRVQGRKRPRSSMAPTFVFDGSGRFVMAIGSPGGSRIIPYVVKALVAVLDWGLDIQSAINLANHTNRNGATELERNTSLEALAPKLQSLGHKVRIRDLESGLHGIMLQPTGILGGADPRREGLALGD